MAEDHDRPGVARRAMLHGASLAGAVALLAGVARGARGDGRPFPPHPRWKLVFVNHVTTNPFFVPTQYGIQDACALLGCDFQWTGSANADVAEMVNAMNAAIAAKADAIAVPIVDPHAFNDPTDRARWRPAFRCSPTTPTRRRQRQQAARLYRPGPLPVRLPAWASGSPRMVDSGLVALFIATPGQLNIQPRLDGAMAAIKKSGKQIEIQSDRHRRRR